MYIRAGSGMFESCSFKGNSTQVSRHAHVGHLRLSNVNVWDALCDLFRTFVFGKVHIVSYSMHEMDFLVFGFCSVAHCMRMSHGYYLFSSFPKLYDRSAFAGCKLACTCCTLEIECCECVGCILCFVSDLCF